MTSKESDALVITPSGVDGLSWVGSGPAPPINAGPLGAALAALLTPLFAPEGGTLDLTRLAKIAREANNRGTPVAPPLAALIDKNRPDGETGGLRTFDELVGLLSERIPASAFFFGLGPVEPREIEAACVLLAASILGKPLWTLLSATEKLDRLARVGYRKDAPESAGELGGWLGWLVGLAFGGYLSMAGTLGTARLAETAGHADIAEQLRNINRDGLDGWTKAPDTPAGNAVNDDTIEDSDELCKWFNTYMREPIVVPGLPRATGVLYLSPEPAPAQLAPAALAEPAEPTAEPTAPGPITSWLSEVIARTFGCAARR